METFVGVFIAICCLLVWIAAFTGCFVLAVEAIEENRRVRGATLAIVGVVLFAGGIATGAALNEQAELEKQRMQIEAER